MKMIRKLITISGMVKKIIAMSAVSMVLALSAPMAALANGPPQYAFGGGERVVHINDNAAAHTDVHYLPHHLSIEQPVHINTATPNYEYGAFLGVLMVERYGHTINVYGGATMESMDLGAGHFSFTGMNHGNVGLIGHNRGSRTGFFSFVRLLEEGDILTLDMNGVTRTYKVFMTGTVYDTDFTPLQQFGCNRLTLITCLENVRNQRRVVSAREIEGGVY